LGESDKAIVEFTKLELQILVNAVGSASPSINDETAQFKLYHKLLFKLNEFKIVDK